MNYTLSPVTISPIELPNSPVIQGFKRMVKSFDFSVNTAVRQVIINCTVDWYDPELNALVKSPGLYEYRVALVAGNTWVHTSTEKLGQPWTPEEIEAHKAAVDAVNNYPALLAQYNEAYAEWELLPEESPIPAPVAPEVPVEPTYFPIEEYDFFVSIVGVNPGLTVTFDPETRIAALPLIISVIQQKAAEPNNKFDRI